MEDIESYNARQLTESKLLCEKLKTAIQTRLTDATAKVWHGHPVWFIDDNPIVGYAVEKAGVKLMFWSGRSFDEPLLNGTSKFKDASIIYTSIDEIDKELVARWLKKAEILQWDYKNIVKRKGELLPLKGVE